MACSDEWIEVEVEDALTAERPTGLEPATPEQIAQLAIRRAGRIPTSTISLKKMTREDLSYDLLTTVDNPDDSLVWVVVYGGPLPDDPTRVYRQVCVIYVETLADDGCQYTSNRVPAVAQTALAG
ncbi:MAG: hypothetical protein F4X20_00020 [Dehalococcoidia bacterium]|nr:hypothetical protein [Dehalococcoidia bacterium]